MRVQEKRIFISDLPEPATQADIESAFKKFGSVVSVEIKTRKEVTQKNSSTLFAYINIEIDDHNLQKCFQYFSSTKWCGQHVVLQIARESFLDRLKRERQENNKKNTTGQKDSPEVSQHALSNNGIPRIIRKHKSSESDESDSSSSSITNDASEIPSNKDKVVNNDQSRIKKIESSVNGNEIADYIIINNKGKKLPAKGELKIETTSNKIKINDKLQEKPTKSQSEANLKRLKSLNNLKKNYKNQKSIIQSALSQIDTGSKNKIIFDDENSKGALSKKHLFDDEDQSDNEINVDFSIKEHFQGIEGQKLLSLQSRYKNDKRFVLDSRFADDNGNDDEKGVTDEENEENSLRKEKEREYEILAEILGKDVSKSKPTDVIKSQKKAMLRFDPTQPEHSKFEMKKEVENQKKRKKNKLEEDVVYQKKQEEKEAPEVSKETFYKVTDNLKESLHEKQEFSLLNMFGKRDEKEIDEQEEHETVAKMPKISKKFMNEPNPFRYDSSDDEEEEETQYVEQHETEQKSVDHHVKERNNRDSSHWSEPFFFKHDDYRLQEGFDFIEKMKVEDGTEFSKIRRDLKEIVKAKVRNNQRKNKPFKKKLGGNRRKKMIKMKKALKR